MYLDSCHWGKFVARVNYVLNIWYNGYFSGFLNFVSLRNSVYVYFMIDFDCVYLLSGVIKVLIYLSTV